MQRYMYKHGDHPLEGYTIQRAAGRGGFGEVYYALSDSGREVALKAVQNYEQIELRGITQCMNLKSPHLVSIFDVKYNDKGQPFVIMEYISGPSLRTLINESPGGLGKQKAAFFLREIAKGLSYLHECGIVHRDLKPGNIFYENGYVKICDYGLTKAISASRHSGHTITVGTVHYMAPEIGAGKYNLGIDIYALGVLLYEMLTGDVPFLGESPAEILMKHMTSEPEMKNIDEPFAHVIKRAMAKDPDERYQTVQEMVEDLFGEENIRNSVSQFAPEELSMIAQRVAAKAKIDEAAKEHSPKYPASEATARNNDQFAKTANNIYEKVDKIGRKVANRVDTQVDTFLGAKNKHIPGVTDPIQPAQRYILAFISIGIVSIGSAFLYGDHVFPFALATFIMTAVCANSILMMKKFWFEKLDPGSQWIERIVTPFSVALIVQFISGIWHFADYKSIFLPMILSMVLIDWRRISLPDRQKRLSLGSALWAGLLGTISSAMFGFPTLMMAAVMAGSSLAVQAISAFGEEIKDFQKPQKTHERKYKSELHTSLNSCIVPRFLRVIFLVGSFLSLGLGIFLIILGCVGNLHDDEFPLWIGFGINSIILSLFLFAGFCRSKFTGWYRYIIKPLILFICLFAIILSSVYMGCVHLRGDEFAISLFFIIFPALAFIFIAAIPAKVIVGDTPIPTASNVPKAAPGVSAFKRIWAVVLCCIPIFGLQRFYVGKIGTGILWFITAGLFGIGQAIDFIMIIMGSFKDRYGLPLVMWFDKDEINNKAPGSNFNAPVNEYKYTAPEYKEPVENYKEPAIDKQSVYTPQMQEQTSSRPFTSSIISGQFHPFSYLCSGIGYILIFAALLISIAAGLHLPAFIATWQGRTEFQHWPEYLIGLGPVIVFIMVIIAAVLIVISRRYSGAFHLIRALLGMIGVFFALLFFSTGTANRYYWDQIDSKLKSGQNVEAFNDMIRYSIDGIFLFFAFIFLVSIVILAWPVSRKQTILTNSQSQGVN